MYLRDGTKPDDRIRVALWGDRADRLKDSLKPWTSIAIENGIRDTWANNPNINTDILISIRKYWGGKKIPFFIAQHPHYHRPTKQR